jgi:transcriptional regulator with XRE-family HTH domain
MKRSEQQKLTRIQRWIDSFCGLYSRVASRLKVDRSYVSRVARGERSSPEVSRALISEFERVQRDVRE